MSLNINFNKNNDEENEEKGGGIIGGIAKAFEKFITIFKKHGILYSVFVLCIISIFYNVIISITHRPINIDTVVSEVLHKEDKIKAEKQEKSVEQRIEADKMINDLMVSLVENFNINRCLLFEIHNGSTNLSNLEYLFYSATSEIINTNNKHGEDVYELEYQADNFQKQHISIFLGQTVYNRLKLEKYLYFSDLDQYHRQSYRFINKMKNIGAESVMIVPFVNSNIPKIILVLSSKDKEMDAPRIYEQIERYRNNIEKLLMNVE